MRFPGTAARQRDRTGQRSMFCPDTAGQVLQQAVADRLADARASVVSGMHKGGLSYAQIAAAAGLSRARAQQLAERGRKLS